MDVLSSVKTILFLLWMPYVSSSSGDASRTFQRYLQSCINDHCSSNFLVKQFEKDQPIHLKLLGWDCDSECKYTSMWAAVDKFKKENLEIPQFYGKWPFIRMFGIQEPASCIFSLLNGLGHLYMIIKLRYTVPKNAPMFYAWHIYSAISIHAWFWSTIFHARETKFTEKMDYFSAFSLNLSGVLMISIRSLALQGFGTDLRIVSASLFILGFIFWRHVSYLSQLKRFDYGYNMNVNLAMGLVNTVWWIGWSLFHLRRKSYLKEPIICILAANLLLLLELGDFPPIFWTFDAHSLWHAGTFPLIFIWYRFVVADSYDLLQEQDRTKAKKGV